MNKTIEFINYKPTVFWAWNGDMKDAEIIRSIDSFHKAGIGGLHLHARAGLTIEYLGEEWMRAYRTTIRECKARNMDVWIYDEQGWPSGFAGGMVCAFGEDYQVKFLSISEKLDFPMERLLASYVKQGDTYTRVADASKANVFVYYSVQEHYVDLLNPEVTKEFIACTHEVYKKEFYKEFGKTIKGVFTDEPQIHVTSRAWSVAIPNAFKEQYGEDVLDGLYLLFENEGDKYQEFRYKYYNVVRELFLNNYTKKIREWCEKNGLIFTGHVAGEEGLCVQVASNTGAMPHYEYLDMPGIDHLGRKHNSVLLLKQIQSVAHQLSKKRVLCETFACTGNGVSFKDLAWIWNYLNIYGVNCPCMSISMYRLGGVRKRDYPVFISEQQPWWEEFSNFNNFVTNTCEFEAEGEHQADVLLISAINSALCEPIFSHKQKVISASYRRAVESLVDLQIPFHIGDERIMKSYGCVNGGKLTVGKGEYSTVVLPELDNIESSTLKLVCDFASSGGKVVCLTKYPTRVDGKTTDIAQKTLESLGVEVLQQRRAILQKYFRNIQYKRAVYVTDLYGKLCDGLHLVYKKTDRGLNIAVLNPSANAQKQVFIKSEGVGNFYRVNTDNNSEVALFTQTLGGDSAVKLTLAPKQCVRLRFVLGDREEVKEEKTVFAQTVEVKMNNLSENAFTVDKASYSINGGEFSEQMPLVKASNVIYNEIEKYQSQVPIALKYKFTCDAIPKTLSFAGETEKAVSVKVNGKDIPVKGEGRFLDQDFILYDISNLVRIGENEIELGFSIEPLRLGFDLESAHDAVRNKFSYPVAIEAIYLKGDFAVREDGEIERSENFIRAEGKFVLTESNKVQGEDITESGYFFYPNNAEYVGEFDYECGKAYLSLDYFGTAVGIEVNGKKVGVDYLSGENKEITEYLVKGKNALKLTLFGSIRNLLGPHHHSKGEPEYTGVHTFTGEYGNGAVEDLCSEENPNGVWNDSYAFAKLGITSVTLEIKK